MEQQERDWLGEAQAIVRGEPGAPVPERGHVMVLQIAINQNGVMTRLLNTVVLALLLRQEHPRIQVRPLERRLVDGMVTAGRLDTQIVADKSGEINVSLLRRAEAPAPMGRQG